MGLAGCPACLLRVLFGPYPRPRGLFSLLGVTVKGLFSGHSYLPRGSLSTPGAGTIARGQKRTRSEGQDGPAEPFQSLRDS